ncbi:hypothetical protein [Microbulbifer donghaiensis]|uniref:hypothetical protein n=1 Tax=Microbulbifer donghaiensis TaxID=494016 RepID=UPI0009343E57|nr:hypothetical protein [Microbulbifer donghaiensis]
MEIPIEVSFEFGKKPSETEVGYLMILAPLRYEGWSIQGVQFSKGKNSIPIMKYVSEKEFPGKALFQVAATSGFLNGSKFTAAYTPDPVVHDDGSVSIMPCLHIQNIDVKI